MNRPERARALRVIRWTNYRLRTCNSLHDCALCGGQITIGDKYRDGGYGRRAHETCGSRMQALMDRNAGLPAGVAHVHVEQQPDPVVQGLLGGASQQHGGDTVADERARALRAIGQAETGAVILAAFEAAGLVVVDRERLARLEHAASLCESHEGVLRAVTPPEGER